MGRPRKKRTEQRCDRLTVRYTEEETQFLRHQAIAAGISVAELIRKRSLGERVQPPPSRSDAAMVNEIHRIGLNVNQLARATWMERDFVKYWEKIGAALEAVLEKVVRAHDPENP